MGLGRARTARAAEDRRSPVALSAGFRRPARALALALILVPVLGASPSCSGEAGELRDGARAPGAGEDVEGAAEPPAGSSSGEAGEGAGPGEPASGDGRSPERLEARVLESYPHDPDAFTQGLLFHRGALYESTGRYGRSELRRVEPETGEALAFRRLPGDLFGEGLALAGDRLVQLTWRSGVALVWDVGTLEPRGELAYAGEGWGLAYDGDRLVMSDGSSVLTFRDPESFAELGRVRVTLRGRPLAQLNELEVVDGAVWANVWGTESVVRIDPATGEVTGIADLSELRGLLSPEEARGIDVLNGIAWWPEREAFLVTGKLWPRAFLVEIE